jgi:hypothetical protein
MKNGIMPGMPGMPQQQEGTGQSAGATSKRQQKMEKRGGQKTVYR